MPDEIEEGHSPIDDLKGFDWGGVDDELAEFLGDTDDESGNESDSSTMSADSKNGRKRKHDEATEDDESDAESSLAKKQRIAHERKTGLKTVKMPNSEGNLPTPGGSGEDDEVDQVPDHPPGEEEEDDEDLEAALMAAFDEEEDEVDGS